VTATAALATAGSFSQLEKIVLQAADLPGGWRASAAQGDPSEAADQADLMHCVGRPNTDIDKVAEVHSADFALGDGIISSSATSYRLQSDLDADVATLHSAKFSPCFDRMLERQFAATMPAGTTIESASVKVTPGSAGGPANVVAIGAGTIKVRLNGRAVPLYVTMAFITGPMIEAQVDTFNAGAPVPPPVVNSLVAAVARRAAKG